MSFRIIDLFCGTGAFSYGIEQSGPFTTVLGIDLKQDRINTFASNHTEALSICGDIRLINIDEIAEKLNYPEEEIDVLVGGPPCQGFSSIRPYRSISENDSRNNLFEQFLVHVTYFEPRFVVFENVVGLVNHKGGMLFRQLVQSLESLGYSLAVGILNTVHFGVPQRRERVIILGRRGSRTPRLPEPTHFYNGRSMVAKELGVSTLPLFHGDLPRAVTLEDAIGDLPPVAAGESAEVYSDNGYVSDYAQERRKDAVKLELHSATRHTPRMLEIIRRSGVNRWVLPEGLTTSGFSSSYSRLESSEPSTTITVNFVHPASNRCIHPTQDRALTPREGARIQSFDDTFEFCGSRTQIVKQIGEAVPPLLARAIGQSILEQW